MRILAQILATILLLSSGVLCFANEMGSSQRSSGALIAQSQQSGEGQLKVKNHRRKDTHRLQRMMDQRDWDHRKAGRDWQMRGDHENLGH